MKNKVLFIGFLLSVFITTEISARELILTAPPRETVEKGVKLYGPIANHLSELLGTRIVYEHPGNWLNYQRDMRNDKYDIVFDGPHFVSWRVAHLGHEVVAKLPGNLQFVLLADKENKNINATANLIGKSFCGISPPNLSTLSVLDHFRNPARQPRIKGIKGGMGKVYKSFKEGKCDAVVLRTAFYKKKLNDAQRSELKQIYLSRKMPNQAISVSSRISKEARYVIRNSLTMGTGTKATSALLKRFGGKAKSMVKANNAEFLPHTALLEGIIFGW
jgi:ABC-type phosphate/phosphonate transport system substrate-binding protein